MVIIQRYISYWVMASTLALVCHYRARNIYKCDTDTWQNGRGREVEDDIKLLLHRHGNLRTDLLSAHKTAFTHYTLPTVIWQTHKRALAHTHIHTHSTTQHTDVHAYKECTNYLVHTYVHVTHLSESSETLATHTRLASTQILSDSHIGWSSSLSSLGWPTVTVVHTLMWGITNIWWSMHA